MTAESYLRFVCELREVKKQGIRDHVEEILTLCGLQEVRGRVLGHLSKGYRQRAGIAQALCGAPEILILDEPTVGLDPKQTAEIRELIKALRAEHTVVFSSHILSEVQQICSRVIILEEGRMVLDHDANAAPDGLIRLRLKIAGKEDAVMKRLRHLDGFAAAELLPAEEAETVEARVTLERGSDSGAALDRAFRILADSGLPVRLMREEREDLEEVFLRTIQSQL
jgi:ABC-2 type transport system ATP-binding protein